MCECLDLGCAEMIPLSHLEYEQLRQEPNRFVVVPGHENAEVEEVTARNSRYLVVRKLGVGGEVAAASDPRSGDA
jgi:hypothetical protein